MPSTNQKITPKYTATTLSAKRKPQKQRRIDQNKCSYDERERPVCGETIEDNNRDEKEIEKPKEATPHKGNSGFEQMIEIIRAELEEHTYQIKERKR